MNLDSKHSKGARTSLQLPARAPAPFQKEKKTLPHIVIVGYQSTKFNVTIKNIYMVARGRARSATGSR